MSEARPRSSLLGDVKTLTKGSATYLIPTIVTRGLSFLLTPVYTRFMSPAEYGIVGFVTSLLPMLSLLLGLSIHSAPSRLWYTLPDDSARRRLNGTVLSFLLITPAVLALAVEGLGAAGVVSFFRSVPFRPYLRLAVWSSVLVLLPNLALNMMVVREEHRRAALFNTLTVLSTAGLTVLMVVVLRRGAEGQLSAVLLANAIVAVPAGVYLWKIGRPRLDTRLLGQALAFSLPLIPHELSKWILAASDRVILEQTVSSADIGRYTLGYTFGSSVGIILSAVSNAFFPIVHRRLAEGDPRGEVPSLGNVVVLTCGFASLEAAAVLPPALKILTPAAYGGAGAVVPWVALGFFFQSLYMVWSQGTFFARRSGGVALVTVIGAGVNVGLNVVLVPRYGFIVAAVTTAVGYAVMALCHAWLAHRVFPIAWQYGRMARIGLAGVAAFGAATLVPGRFGPWVEVLGRGAVTVVAYPVLLFVLGAARRDEIAWVRSVLTRRKPTSP